MGVPVGIAPVALQQFFDVDGNPLAGGLLYTYASTTTTPLATYADAGGVTVNPNPMVLDSGGFASPGLFLQALAYTFALTDANNIPQWSQDGVVSEQAVAAVNNPSQTNFTSSGTFTVPTNVSGAKVTVIGGGGAGGGGTAGPQNGAGGGAGGLAYAWLSGLVPGQTITVTIGTGGVGVSGASGGSGGNSSISGTGITTVTAGGGGGGATGAGVQAGGSGGTSTGGTLNFTGNTGEIGVSPSVSNYGSPGAGSIFGGGGMAAFQSNGNPGLSPGAGGSGAGGNAARTGGAGAAGIVIFEYLQ